MQEGGIQLGSLGPIIDAVVLSVTLFVGLSEKTKERFSHFVSTFAYYFTGNKEKSADLALIVSEVLLKIYIPIGLVNNFLNFPSSLSVKDTQDFVRDHHISFIAAAELCLFIIIYRDRIATKFSSKIPLNVAMLRYIFYASSGVVGVSLALALINTRVPLSEISIERLLILISIKIVGAYFVFAFYVIPIIIAWNRKQKSELILAFAVWVLYFKDWYNVGLGRGYNEDYFFAYLTFLLGCWIDWIMAYYLFAMPFFYVWRRNRIASVIGLTGVLSALYSVPDRYFLPFVYAEAVAGSGYAQEIIAEAYEDGFELPRSDANAFIWYKRAADQGISAAQLHEALFLLSGRGEAKQDEAAAVRWLQKASESPYAPALFELGTLYADGRGGLGKDEVRALQLYRKAADLKDPDAEFQIGLFYQFGRADLRQSDLNAVHWYRLAADRGQPVAQVQLGNYYRDGSATIDRDLSESVKLFQQAADQDYPPGAYNLGVAYEQGNGVPQDTQKALLWFRKAADKGLAIAQNAIGNYYLTGKGGLQENDAEAVHWYTLAADQDDPRAEVALGVMYADGSGGLKADAVKAVLLFRRSADQNNDDAEFQMAIAYINGMGGLEQNDANAVVFLERAAKKGNGKAQTILGAFHQLGKGGLTKSDAQAVELYQLAAEKKVANAELALGGAYIAGSGGLPVDPAKGAALIKEAAESGLAIAQCALGALYQFGEGGLPKDNQKAALWYQRAADQQHPIQIEPWQQTAPCSIR